MSSENWIARAAEVRWNVQPFIGGRYQPSKSAHTFDNVNPSDESVLCRVSVGDVADIDDAVVMARRRFKDGSWSRMAPQKRAEILLKLADLIVRKKYELALLDTLEIGKPISWAIYDADTFAPELLRSWAGFSDKMFGQSAPLTPSTVSFNTYEPRGVVGAITPWNFPLVCAIFKVGPALAAGNTVVLKPSELSSSSALRLAELAIEAGVPEGVLNVVPGLGSTVGSALALHPDVNLLSFTGSTRTGRKLMEMSGRSNGKPLLLECGGKSPHVVFDDIENLDRVADSAAEAILWNQGQVCSAHTRLIVHEGIADELLARVVRRAKNSQSGSPLNESTTFGPLASTAQRDRVRAYIKQGLEAGASVVLRGEIQDSAGCYVQPTIFDRVETSMSIAREEIFGPVLCVQRFRTLDEARALANGTEYGLAATVWTRDGIRGRRLAYDINAGNVRVRTGGEEEADSGYALSYEPQKSSGFGAERGLGGLKSYSTLKLVSFVGS